MKHKTDIDEWLDTVSPTSRRPRCQPPAAHHRRSGPNGWNLELRAQWACPAAAGDTRAAIRRRPRHHPPRSRVPTVRATQHSEPLNRRASAVELTTTRRGRSGVTASGRHTWRRVYRHGFLCLLSPHNQTRTIPRPLHSITATRRCLVCLLNFVCSGRSLVCLPVLLAMGDSSDQQHQLAPFHNGQDVIDHAGGSCAPGTR